jgi:quinol-cytochrome oxidoreductase complex cytochrome b subunit
MIIKIRLPRIFSEQASLDIIRNLFRDILTYYALLGLLLAACKLFTPPTAVPDWLFLISAAICAMISLLWVAAITTENLNALERMSETRKDKVWVIVMMFFSCMMLLLALWAAVKIAY